MKDWWVTRREPMKFYQARADWLEERRRRRQDRELIEKKADEFREYQRKYGEQPKKMATPRPNKFFLIKGEPATWLGHGGKPVYWTGAIFSHAKRLSCIYCDEYAAKTAQEEVRAHFDGDEQVSNIRVVTVNRIATSEAERSVLWNGASVIDLSSDHLENVIRFVECGGRCDHGPWDDVTRAARQELKRRGRNVH